MREVEVRPVRAVNTPGLEPVVEFTTTHEAEAFGVYVEDRHGQFIWQRDEDSKESALTQAFLLARRHAQEAGVEHRVVYRAEETEETWQAGPI